MLLLTVFWLFTTYDMSQLKAGWSWWGGSSLELWGISLLAENDYCRQTVYLRLLMLLLSDSWKFHSRDIRNYHRWTMFGSSPQIWSFLNSATSQIELLSLRAELLKTHSLPPNPLRGLLLYSIILRSNSELKTNPSLYWVFRDKSKANNSKSSGHEMAH